MPCRRSGASPPPPAIPLAPIPARPPAERYAKIEHENRLLLQRMSEILVKPGGANSYAQGAARGFASRGEAPPAHAGGGRRSRSLNSSGKRRELERITHANLALLARLQGVKPVLSRAAWERHAEANAALVETISEYGGAGARGIYGGGGGGGGGVARARSRSPSPATRGGGNAEDGGGGGGGALSRGMAQLAALGLPGFGGGLGGGGGSGTPAASGATAITFPFSLSPPGHTASFASFGLGGDTGATASGSLAPRPLYAQLPPPSAAVTTSFSPTLTAAAAAASHGSSARGISAQLGLGPGAGGAMAQLQLSSSL